MPPRRIRTSFRPITPPLLVELSPSTPPKTLPPYELSSSPFKASAAPKTRLKKAVRYLRRHPDDSKTQVALNYGIHRRTLSNAVQRVPLGPRQHGGQNKGVRVGTHKDYEHGRSELPSRDTPADVDEGTGTTSAQAPTKRLLGHY